MTNGMVKTENGKLIAHPLAAHLYRPLRPSGTSPNLEEESGCGLTYRFQVLGTPLLCPSKIGVTSPQGGGGMTTAVPVLRSFYRPLRPSGTLSLT